MRLQLHKTWLYKMKYYLAPDSALHSAPCSKTKKISVLGPSLTIPRQCSYFNTRHFTLLFHLKKNDCAFHRTRFRNIQFLPRAQQFTQWMRCVKFKISTYLLVIYQQINIFTRDTLYPSFIPKKIGTLHRKLFLKHPLFTTFSLFLKVPQVCNISNKY